MRTMMLPGRVALGAALAAGLLACTGCTHVIATVAPYYREGPQQPSPPDGWLEPGTPVAVWETRDGFRRVWTRDGVIAFVHHSAIVTRSQWQRIQQEREKNKPETVPKTGP